MKELNLKDVSQHLLFELEYNYGIEHDEELKQVYLLENKEFIVITSKRAIIHTNELHHKTKNLNTAFADQYEVNRLGNLQVELELEEMKTENMSLN
jgi:hypothetical protein